MNQRYKYLIPSIYIIIFAIIFACSKEEEFISELNASAGKDMNVPVGQLVTLNGSGSGDSRGNDFEFSWKFISKPILSNTELDLNTTAMPNFTPDTQGKYKIELTISNTSESKDTVTVSAFKVNSVNGTYENLFPGPDVGIRDFTSACEQLIATCEFTEIGGVEAAKIARYDGSNWNSIGCGLDIGSIYDMIEYKGELWVTGDFDEVGCIPAEKIARWDCDNEWMAVEGGLSGGDDPFGYTLAIYNDELYVGGRFTQAGGVSAGNIAKWDGTNWSAVGSIENGSVRELQVYNQKLYVGGFFDAVNGINTGHIASYDGASWSALGTPDALELNGTGVVRHMAVYKDLLYISGDFSINGNDVSELITWNGSQFSDFGRAFSLYQGNTISELTVIEDILYIGGSFRNVVGGQANNILQWDGENWGIMSEGISGTVLSIERYKDKIYIGGDFNGAGGQVAENISIWAKN